MTNENYITIPREEYSKLITAYAKYDVLIKAINDNLGYNPYRDDKADLDGEQILSIYKYLENEKFLKKVDELIKVNENEEQI